ncbi:hypothetical protein NMY22_g16765 [Coprinellus aureogranulatus]|nr:hypothetical protein NMY22_g16765 [Coprinellus aureogranulatus]
MPQTTYIMPCGTVVALGALSHPHQIPALDTLGLYSCNTSPNLRLNAMDEDARPGISIMPNSDRTSAESISITAPGRDMIVSPNSSAGSSQVSIQLFVVNGETPIQISTSAEGPARARRTSDPEVETRSGMEGGTARDGDSRGTAPAASFSMWRVVRFFSNIIGRNTEGRSVRPTPASSSVSVDTTTTTASMAESDRESDVTLESIGESDTGSAQPRSRAFHEIYVLKLLGTGYGLPCWEPGPSPPEIVPQGVVPGDVGTYSTEWGFEKTFNLWDDKDVLQQLAARHSAGPNQALTGRVRTRHDALRPGVVFSPGAACDSKPPPRSFDDYFVLHEFRYRSTPGAILALVSSADCEITDDIEAMQSYILRNPEAIYRHANSIRRIGGNGSLYIITGCVKTDAWAMAAYQELPADEYDRLRISELSRTDPFGTDRLSNSYQWTKTAASSHARLGDSGVEGLKDQALFLQGFKLTFSSHRGEFEDGTGQDDPDPPDSDPPDSGPGPDTEDDTSKGACDKQPADPSSGASSLLNSIVLTYSGCLLTYRLDAKHCELFTISPGIWNSTPSLRCYQQLTAQTGGFKHGCAWDNVLQSGTQKTGAELALSHDNDWRYLIRSATTDPYSAAASSNGHMEVDGASEANASGSCGARLEDGFEAPPMPEVRTVSVRNGVAYLLPPEHSVSDRYQGRASSSAQREQRLCLQEIGAGSRIFVGVSGDIWRGETSGSSSDEEADEEEEADLKQRYAAIVRLVISHSDSEEEESKEEQGLLRVNWSGDAPSFTKHILAQTIPALSSSFRLPRGQSMPLR